MNCCDGTIYDCPMSGVLTGVSGVHTIVVAKNHRKVTLVVHKS